jgi:ABC-type uncharacterized transport system auxiliary subunit
MLAVAAMAGCATREFQPSLQLRLSPVANVSETTPTDKVIAVRQVDAARPYKGDIAVYREPNVIDSIQNRTWAEWPRDVVTRTLYDAVVASKHFKDAGMATELQLPDLVLAGEIRAFDLIAYESPWTAVCEVRLEVRDVKTGESAWAKTLQKRVPLASNDESALPAAMSEAVSQLVTEAVTEISKL